MSYTIGNLLQNEFVMQNYESTADSTSFKCLACKKSIKHSNSTSNLIQHFKRCKERTRETNAEHANQRNKQQEQTEEANHPAKRLKKIEEAEPVKLFNKFLCQNPTYFELAVNSSFHGFLQSVGVEAESPTVLKEKLSARLQEIVKEENVHYCTIQLTDIDAARQQIVKIDLLFVNKQFQTVKFTLDVLKNDPVNDDNLLEEFGALITRFGLDGKVVQVETRFTSPLKESIARKLNLKLIRPMPNRIIALFDRSLGGKFASFRSRFNSIVDLIAKSEHLLAAIQENKNEKLSVPDSIKEHDGFREFLQKLEWSLDNAEDVKLAFQSNGLKNGDLFSGVEEEQSMLRFKTDLNESSRLLESICKPANKSRFLYLLGNLITEVKQIEINNYSGTTKTDVTAIVNLLNSGLNRLKAVAARDISINWWSFLDVRLVYRGAIEHKLQREFQLKVMQLSAAPDSNDEQGPDDEDLTAGESKTPKCKTDEFADFKKEHIYDAKKKLSEIFENFDFSVNRYPVMADICKTQFCRQTFIPKFSYSPAKDLDLPVSVQIFLRENESQL